MCRLIDVRGSGESGDRSVRNFVFLVAVGIVAAVVSTLTVKAWTGSDRSSRPGTDPSPGVTTSAPAATTPAPAATTPAPAATTPAPAATTPAPAATTPAPAATTPARESADMKVPLANLCKAPGAVGAYFCTPGTAEVGGQVFQYAVDNAGTSTPYWNPEIKFPANQCSQIVLQFAAEAPHPESDSARLQVVQSSKPLAIATANPGVVGTLSTPLDGGPFEIDGDSSNASRVGVNGYALCKTPYGV
jgi:hypothetical protein